MTKYRGYYIDKVVFSSKSEIDAFVKQSIIDKIKQFNKMMMSSRYSDAEKIQLAGMISDRERRLHDEFEMSWEEVENIF